MEELYCEGFDLRVKETCSIKSTRECLYAFADIFHKFYLKLNSTHYIYVASFHWLFYDNCLLKDFFFVP